MYCLFLHFVFFLFIFIFGHMLLIFLQNPSVTYIFFYYFQKLILQGGKKSAPQDQVDEIVERYDILEKFLTGAPYVALGHLTIADFSLIATVTTSDILIPVDAKKYPKITAWIKKISALPYYAANKNGLDKLRGLIQAALEG